MSYENMWVITELTFGRMPERSRYFLNTKMNTCEHVSWLVMTRIFYISLEMVMEGSRGTPDLYQFFGCLDCREYWFKLLGIAAWWVQLFRKIFQLAGLWEDPVGWIKKLSMSKFLGQNFLSIVSIHTWVEEAYVPWTYASHWKMRSNVSLSLVWFS